MHTPIKLALATTLILTISSPLALANDVTPIKPASGLILEIDLSTLNAEPSDNAVIHTYNDVAVKKKIDSVSKRILGAKRAIKRLTSLRFKKNQKFRALIGKSNYGVQYTYKL